MKCSELTFKGYWELSLDEHLISSESSIASRRPAWSIFLQCQWIPAFIPQSGPIPAIVAQLSVRITISGRLSRVLGLVLDIFANLMKALLSFLFLSPPTMSRRLIDVLPLLHWAFTGRSDHPYHVDTSFKYDQQ